MRATRLFWERVQDFPPVLCRLLAKHDAPPKTWQALTHEEIADRSGLDVLEVMTLSKRTSWDGVDLCRFRQFTQACGIDFLNSKHMIRVRDYVRKRGRFAYLKRDPLWDTYYSPLIKIWRDSYARRTGLGKDSREGIQQQEHKELRVEAGERG